MNEPLVLKDISELGIAKVTLNRPDKHNAFDEALILDLSQTFVELGQNKEVRLIILKGAGQNFCAGADLGWMQRAAAKSEADNQSDALNLAKMLRNINDCPKPVIGCVQGACLGGGVGLVACCDVVVCAPDALFGLSEVRLGLMPATISPFVISKIGQSSARRYMLSGERFGPEEAKRLGLVHEIKSGFEAASQPLIDAFLASGPEAISDTKALISDIAHKDITQEILNLTATRIAARRISPEGREGISAFLEKRQPKWVR
jgi:methylglutaconyl-CoA hydratase